MGIFLFVCGVIWIVIKLVCFGIKAAWGITKLMFSALFLPMVLIALFVCGFKYLAIIGLVLIIMDVASNRRTA
ncbi:MAG TPA: hypothetical protein PLO47_03065 [Bacillota bacterium]|nr:hypothetical protein [Bacillota bacterium]